MIQEYDYLPFLGSPETKKDTKAVALVWAGKLFKNSLAEVSNRKQTMKQDFNQH